MNRSANCSGEFRARPGDVDVVLVHMEPGRGDDPHPGEDAYPGETLRVSTGRRRHGVHHGAHTGRHTLARLCDCLVDGAEVDLGHGVRHERAVDDRVLLGVHRPGEIGGQVAPDGPDHPGHESISRMAPSFIRRARSFPSVLSGRSCVYFNGHFRPWLRPRPRRTVKCDNVGASLPGTKIARRNRKRTNRTGH